MKTIKLLIVGILLFWTQVAFAQPVQDQIGVKPNYGPMIAFVVMVVIVMIFYVYMRSLPTSDEALKIKKRKNRKK